MNHANIIGWGTCVPNQVVTNDDLAQRIDTSDEWIRTRSGIRERRIVREGETTATMATEAGRRALAKAGVAPTDLDLIIVASSSPDYLMPPVSSQVQDMLGAKDVGAFQMTVGCTGFVYAMVTAQQFIATGACKTVLVIGAELISRFLDWEDRTTCVLFGDGAAAVVLQATDEQAGVLGFVLGSDGSGAEHIMVKSGGVANPPTVEAIEAKETMLRMNGREVFKFATRTMVAALQQALGQANLGFDDIDLFIPHQANARIIEYAAKQAGLPAEKVMLNVDRYGNTSAASVPIALCEAFETGRIRPGDTLAMVAFGSGLTWGAAIFQLGQHIPALETLATATTA